LYLATHAGYVSAHVSMQLTSWRGADFVDRIVRTCPLGITIYAIQVDGGSEVRRHCVNYCQYYGFTLVVTRLASLTGKMRAWNAYIAPLQHNTTALGCLPPLPAARLMRNYRKSAINIIITTFIESMNCALLRKSVQCGTRTRA